MADDAGAVRKVLSAEAERLSGVMARAFEFDPMSVHLLPDETRRRGALALAFRMFLRHVYLPRRESYTVGELHGGALWLPPGGYPPTARQQWRLLPVFARVLGLVRTPGALRDLYRVERMHPTARPHWYLAFLGVEPARQGSGLGGALMRPALGRCDAGRVPAYLETSNERNLPLYERNGFRVVDECDIPGGPHFWGMWREPRAPGGGTRAPGPPAR